MSLPDPVSMYHDLARLQPQDHGSRIRGVLFTIVTRMLSKYVEVRLEQNVYETPHQRLEALWYEQPPSITWHRTLPHLIRRGVVYTACSSVSGFSDDNCFTTFLVLSGTIVCHCVCIYMVL